jgi:hypothetical protein
VFGRKDFIETDEVMFILPDGLGVFPQVKMGVCQGIEYGVQEGFPYLFVEEVGGFSR